MFWRRPRYSAAQGCDQVQWLDQQVQRPGNVTHHDVRGAKGFTGCAFALHDGDLVAVIGPDHAEALFDIRYTENDDMEQLIEDLRKQIQGELAVESKEPLFRGGDSPFLDLLLSIAKDTTVGFEHGASDARFLSDYGIKGIVWGADGDMTQHSLDEHLNIESAFALYRILDEFVTRVADSKETRSNRV